jgi:uncharacterized protein (DUF4415 family)
MRQNETPPYLHEAWIWLEQMRFLILHTWIKWITEEIMAKLKNIKPDWVDPDDAPELDEQWFQDAHVYIGDTLIKRGVGRPPIKNTKEMLSLRIDFDVLEKLRASGKGWQTRLSKHIKEAVMKGLV